jgi:antitoxin CptB|tara:strand:+ start:525 stop:791 length:267 start_codon:yes stop_codon:yes gene_type:complete
MEDIEIFRKKLIFKSSHRGVKEMDILIGNFVLKFISLFDIKELICLDSLLDFEDDIIYKIIIGKLDIPDALNSRVTHLLIDYSNNKDN